jgi:hypothetical protein
MIDRWLMKRMGFVNFWLYDEEIFEFADGKLFLRGANASGKSITTQSFIPFILDGNKSPGRLDPFGSKDRKMEYYFLGDGEKEEATGYLFLEFKRGDSEQYRTIGIGQKAQKGKDMSFWGFVILDGKRIGYDINLYKEIGSSKMPFTMSELEKVLETDKENLVVSKAGDYKELVNKHIFGFSRMEQYEQFIKLLIKVRAPKLSKDFKPTDTYQILNESLQTLSDEDLRAMVDAMEKMDLMQEKQAGLRAAFNDIRTIRNEYERYNRFVLARKAQKYLEIKNETDFMKSRLDVEQDEFEKKKKQQNSKTEENDRLLEMISTLEKEQEVLDSSDLDSNVDKLERAKKRESELEHEKTDSENRIEHYRNKIKDFDFQQREIRNKMENCEAVAEQIVSGMEELNETLLMDADMKEVSARMREGDNHNGLADLKKLVKKYKEDIGKGLNVLNRLFEVEKKRSLAEERYQQAETDKIRKEKERDDAEIMESQFRDNLINAWYILDKEYEEMLFGRKELQSIISQIKIYKDPKDQSEVTSIVNNIYLARKTFLSEAQIRCNAKKEELADRYNSVLEEIRGIKNMKIPVPQRRSKVEAARRILEENHIRCFAFYEVIEFGQDVTEAEKCLLEEQLMDSGLLDALVVAPKDLHKTIELLKSLSDTILLPRQQGGSGLIDRQCRLVPGEVDGELKLFIRQLLDSIGTNEGEETDIIFCTNGYFRNGLIYGHSNGGEHASYVGLEARREKLKQMLAEKEAEKKELQNLLTQYEDELGLLNHSITRLIQEKEEIPDFDELDEAIDLKWKMDGEYERAFKELESKELELKGILAEKKTCEQNVITVCKALPFTRTIEAYSEALDCAAEYADETDRLERELFSLRTVEAEKRYITGMVEQQEDVIDQIDLQLRKTKRDLSVCKAEIAAVEEFLNSPKNKVRAERLKVIKSTLNDYTEVVTKNRTDIAVLGNEMDRLLSGLQSLKNDIVMKIGLENRVRSYFAEEIKLKLVMEPGEEISGETARNATGYIRENDKERSMIELTTSLNNNYRQHSSNLVPYGTVLENIFEDDPDFLRRRQCIVSTWQGKKLGLEEFYQVLKEAIESNELLIQERDRKLFEDILADTLSRKLNARIQESRIWIRDMSKLMKEMDTSMSLTFSLDWRPKVSESEHEMDTLELEKLLNRDRELLSNEDIDKVSKHFRSKIMTEKHMKEENGEVINYADMVRDALDYRKWFEFHMHYYRGEGQKKNLTNSVFNTFSGGEKAMAMYVPLFAAVNAQYKKAEKEGHPRMIALDEAFAGVDDKNINSMFELVQKLDFDYIMNSQVLWGCYETVRSLRIAELHRPSNSNVVTVIHYYWNGKERILDVQ